MNFNSLQYYLFLPIVIVLYYILPVKLRNPLLLIASYFFYMCWQPAYALLMLTSTAITYFCGICISRYPERKKIWLATSLILNLAILFFFKYFNFVASLITDILSAANLNVTAPSLDVLLPVGISFYTFQALSYVLDVHRGRGGVQVNPLKVGLYISFFPQLIAGPIVKYETVADQIDNRRENWPDFSAGACRFVVGLGKKVLIANQLAVVADRAFQLSGQGLASAGLAWLGAVCYTLQIYYDFSGYSDMAIGLGKMFGFHFLENFTYLAKSVTEFWRRWHISLSTWFRDYVYFPLGGSRVKSPWRHVGNLFVVWLLTGVWHGANWTFLCWGLLYFVLLVLEKFAGLGRGWPACLRWLFTMLMVNFAWVLFRADDLGAAGQFLAAMFNFGAQPDPLDRAGYYLRQYAVVLLFAALFAFPVARWLSVRVGDYLRRYAAHVLPMWGAVYSLTLLTVLLAAAAYLVKGTYNPFIYFNF